METMAAVHPYAKLMLQSTIKWSMTNSASSDYNFSSQIYNYISIATMGLYGFLF